MSEGLPPPPPALEALVPADRVAVMTAYAELLADDGVVRGLIGPREAPRLWERHVLNCALLAPSCPPEASVADIGSGAGLPGLVLAIARPDLSVTLIEPLLRRTTFLDEVVESLRLKNVTVLRGRAEELHRKGVYDVVTSRAVAPLDRLLRWSMPLVAPTGQLIAMKGASAEDEVEAAQSVWSALGCAQPVVEIIHGADQATAHVDDVEPIRLVRVSWADPTRVSLPSRSRRGRKSTPAPRSRNTRRKS